MHPEVEEWRLTGFLDRIDEWVEAGAPEPDLRLILTDWVFSRFSDPYLGVRRESGFPNLWFGVVPGTAHGDRQVVVCSYWIEESTHSVRCDRISSLGTPL